MTEAGGKRKAEQHDTYNEPLDSILPPASKKLHTSTTKEDHWNNDSFRINPINSTAANDEDKTHSNSSFVIPDPIQRALRQHEEAQTQRKLNSHSSRSSSGKVNISKPAIPPREQPWNSSTLSQWNSFFGSFTRPVLGLSAPPALDILFVNPYARRCGIIPPTYENVEFPGDSLLSIGEILPQLLEKISHYGLEKLACQGCEIFDIKFPVNDRIDMNSISSPTDTANDCPEKFFYRSASLSPVLGDAGHCLGITVIFSFCSTDKHSQHVLDKLKVELEQKVKERTRELEEINAELLRENKERRRVQSELTLVSMVAQKTDTGVIITDKDRQTVWVNKAFTRATGFTLKDMYGKSPGRVLQCSQTDRGTVKKIAAELGATKGICVDILNRRKDGTLLMVNLDITPVLDEEGNLHHFVALQREINPSSVEQMRAAAVEQAKAQAMANRMKTDFIMNMSHELRTPLNGILGMTSALLHSSLQDVEDLRQGLETILVSSKLLLTLINNIIDLSKIESGKMVLDESSADLQQLLKETVAACQPLARDKQIDISFDFDERICQHAICDSLKVRQVLINLIGNAIKFTRNGGAVKIAVTKGERRASPHEPVAPVDMVEASPESRVLLKFSVSDQGPGIPEDQVGNLFGRFVQLDQSQENKVRYGGSGLGLHISREFVTIMRGSIWVDETKPGKGSTFAFVIPVIPCVDQKASLIRAQIATSLLTERLDSVSQSWPPLRILVVEDNVINQKVILRLLSRFGFTHQVANNGQEAIDVLKNDVAFDLILMDVQMPVMDGLTAARKINELFPKRPKIAALTANVMKTEMAACIQAGMDFYISKPVTTKKLFNFFVSFFKKSSSSTETLATGYESPGSASEIGMLENFVDKPYE